MSTAIATAGTPRPGFPARSVGADTAPDLSRLAVVELRKMSDTLAGLWTLIGVLAISVLTVIITCATGHANHHTFRHILSNSLQPLAILLPVVGVLLVTSEFSQRTTLTSFTLVPRRSRVLLAKLIAAATLSIPMLVFCVLISVIATALASSGVHGAWTLQGGIFAQAFLYLATAMITGVAFGAALLYSAPAILTFFGLPMAFTALTSTIGKHSFLSWIDNATTLSPMTQHLLSGREWGRVGTTLAVWMLLPLAIGLWRLLRSEIK
jgi:ABC-type transport system involved in multi-copper enzyme maturation permease subunit